MWAVVSCVTGSSLELSPLPIEGLFYQWSMDLCGPFPVSGRGNRYVAVMIEHFSKTVVLEPLHMYIYVFHIFHPP